MSDKNMHSECEECRKIYDQKKKPIFYFNLYTVVNLYELAKKEVEECKQRPNTLTIFRATNALGPIPNWIRYEESLIISQRGLDEIEKSMKPGTEYSDYNLICVNDLWDSLKHRCLRRSERQPVTSKMSNLYDMNSRPNFVKSEYGFSPEALWDNNYCEYYIHPRNKSERKQVNIVELLEIVLNTWEQFLYKYELFDQLKKLIR